MSHPHRPFGRRLVAPCVLWGALTATAWTDSRDNPRAASLIDRLSGPSFQDRLNAEDECLENGDAVLPALQSALKSPDPELRLRAGQLIRRIEEGGIQKSVAAFLAPHSTTELPGWSFVSEIVGDTPDTRSFYAQLLQAESNLAQALRRPEMSGRELIRRQQEFGQTVFNGGTGSPTPNRVACMLILLLHPDLDVPDLVRNDTTRLISFGLTSMSGDTPPEKFVQALALHWVATPRPATAQLRFELGNRLSSAEVLIPAMELLRAKPLSNTAGNLFLTVTRYGGPNELADLELLLSDSTVQWTHERQNDSKAQTQVRDLALAALIEMTHQNATDYGLKAFDRDSNQRISRLLPVFESDTAREDALKKWKHWSAQHLKKSWTFPQAAQEGWTL